MKRNDDIKEKNMKKRFNPQRYSLYDGGRWKIDSKIFKKFFSATAFNSFLIRLLDKDVKIYIIHLKKVRKMN